MSTSPDLALRRQRRFSATEFRDPVAFILAEHMEQHRLCGLLENLASDLAQPSAREIAADIVDYLTHELPLHEADEEADLFPLLKIRSIDIGMVDDILAQLSREHGRDDEFVAKLMSDLVAIASGIAVAVPLDFIVGALRFAETQRRHLDWENTVIVPIARRILGPGDLAALGRSMAARRGCAYPD
ncbi:MAG: hemerythrin domain-containing protein [Proteobacteria bacterium]|nr:hemerythrin domain-containing protein [Pseudomonadota bacterium]